MKKYQRRLAYKLEDIGITVFFVMNDGKPFNVKQHAKAMRLMQMHDKLFSKMLATAIED